MYVSPLSLSLACRCSADVGLVCVWRTQTPFNAEPSFKPIAGVTRYIAIEGGSFFDSTLRGFFVSAAEL